MASFLDMLGYGEDIPAQVTIKSPAEQIAEAGAILPMVAQQTTDYERALAEGRLPSFLKFQSALSPFARESQLTAQQQILESLTDPYSVDPEAVTAALQRAGATGFGASQAGRYDAASMFERGLRERRERAQERALSLGQYIPGIDYVLQTQAPYGNQPGMTGLGLAREKTAAQDFEENMKRDAEAQASSKLYRLGTQIVLAGVGGYFGGPAGAQAGYQVGGQLVPGQRVQGFRDQQQDGGGGNMFSSILGGLGGGGSIGGPNQGIGSQSAYRSSSTGIDYSRGWTGARGDTSPSPSFYGSAPGRA